MTKTKIERRKYQRYDTEVKIYFRVNYEIETKVRFQVLAENKASAAAKKYPALSKNVNVEGISFISSKKLEKGNKLWLEVYLPKAREPIGMEGEVIWSRLIPSPAEARRKYMTGVKLTTVNKKDVSETIYYDRTYKVVWSIVLESVLGSFRIFAHNRGRE